MPLFAFLFTIYSFLTHSSSIDMFHICIDSKIEYLVLCAKVTKKSPQREQYLRFAFIWVHVYISMQPVFSVSR